MRHAVANALYALGRALDAPEQRCDGGKLHFGDEGRDAYDPHATAWNLQIHARDATRISADFHPPEYGYSYAALHVADATVFLTRRATLALIDVLRGVEAAYAKHGEGNRR